VNLTILTFRFKLFGYEAPRHGASIFTR
jgi:hypothetical protein